MLGLLTIFSIAFGPAALILDVRALAGSQAACAIWKACLRWVYFAAIGIGGTGLVWWAKVDGVAETDTAVLFGIACMLLTLITFSGAVSWTVVRSPWVSTHSGVTRR